MSNLILPENYQSPFLEGNLKAFFARYPYERARLEPIFRGPSKPLTIPQLALPPFPEKPPMRIMILLGIFNPMFLATILNDKKIQEECFKVFIVENDPEFLAAIFQHSDLTQIINAEKTEWFLCHTVESLKPAFFRALKPEAITSMMLNSHLLSLCKSTNESINQFYELVHRVFDETIGHVFHNHGTLDDSLTGLEVSVRNRQFIEKCPGIHELKNHYKNGSALIVGAGPSLDRNLETIKKYNDRFVIIAADAALKPLVKAGIRVDYVTSIERLNHYQVPFFKDCPQTEAELVAFPVVHPEVLAIFPGTVRLVYRNYSFFAYFEKAFPKGILKSGGSTAHLGVRLADWLGVSKITFIGLDSTYEEKDGLYRSHCSGTGHENWGEFIPLEEFHTVRRHAPAVEAFDNLGRTQKTNITYYQWIKEYAEETSYLGHRIQFTSASDTALKIEGIPYKPLEEIASQLDPMIISKPKNFANNSTRAWDNKDLLKNFKSWFELCEEGIKEADRLTKADLISLEEFVALHYVYAYRLVIDDMFVSFIVQCCATDFFKLENKWFALALDPMKNVKEKIAILRSKFELFKQTLERLVKAFEEGSSNE